MPRRSHPPGASRKNRRARSVEIASGNRLSAPGCGCHGSLLALRGDSLHAESCPDSVKEPKMDSVTRAWRIAGSAVFILTVLAISSAAAKAANVQVAQIKTVSGLAEIVRNGARTTARVGDPLYEKYTIEP